MASIRQISNGHWVVRIRRKGIVENRTFETRTEANNWSKIVEGKIVGDEYKDVSLAKKITFKVLMKWYIDKISFFDENGVTKYWMAGGKNNKSIANYWMTTKFADMPIVSISRQDLIGWRRVVLDEANGSSRNPGPDAEVGAQTVMHRLQVVRSAYKLWGEEHGVELTNPVGYGVRPKNPEGRSRRLSPIRDANGMNELERLLAACRKSPHKWLEAVVVIALETGLRQGEIGKAKWVDVYLDDDNPYIFVPETKNGHSREVGLSPKAVNAFNSLIPRGGAIPTMRIIPVKVTREIAYIFRKAVSSKDFPDFHFHDCRHHAISNWYKNTNLRDPEIMALSGHRDPKMLVRYAHIDARKLGRRLPDGADNRAP